MTSTLFIMRHGSAEYANPGGDSKRNLNQHGVDEALLVGRVFETMGPPDLVIHSPYVRTTQTAEHVVSRLSLEPAVLKADALRSGSRPEEMIAEIGAHQQFSRILAIGHMPDVAEVVLMLTGSDDLPEMFVPATVVALDVSQGWSVGSLEVKWMDTPVHIGKRL